MNSAIEGPVTGMSASRIGTPRSNHVREAKHVNKCQQTPFNDRRDGIVPLRMLLLHSSSPSIACSTPSRSSYYSARSHQPINSSPLASPSYSSPTHHAQERRRAQYKSMTHAYRSPTTHTSANLLFRAGTQTPTDPQKMLLRERFQARCREHAQKLRERAVSSRRSSDRYSDVFMEYDDDEESDDVIMQDEVRYFT